MPPFEGVEVQGLAELQRALKYADRATRLGIRKEMREVVEPVRRDAQTLTGLRIRRIHTNPDGPDWTKMRIGITQDLVYLAPRQRGVKARGDHPAKRRNLADLMMSRAMEPALYQNQAAIVYAFNEMLNRIAVKFNRA